ncbi:MAG: protein-L-isoaspartate(D-aspartate) O-methyltransferase [Spirochaetes bacterium]|nr:protein-L-isoaspartate(D-aspartate) O-methyltransferase [Spirochaetota bacterium]
MDFTAEKEKMIQEHLIARGICDSNVINAMRKVKRENFVISNFHENAYSDSALETCCGQTISQPYIVALMTEQLEIFPEAKVLEIGTGSGYQTALLRELSRHIFSIEKIPELAEKAKLQLENEGYSDIAFRTGSGYEGWKEEAPFDRIIVTCAPASIPAGLTDQLSKNGIMIIPAGGTLFQTLFKVVKTCNKLEITEICAVRFVPMVE